MNTSFSTYRRLGLCAILLLACLAPLAASAQTTLPPTPGFEERARKKTSLDRKSKEVADEYADILYELQTIVRDYREYLDESESKTIVKYMVKLDQLSANLDKRVYVADRKRLVEDLTAHIDELRTIQTYIEDSEEIFPMRILKVVASLRRDLSNIDDQLESDILERLAEVRANDDAIQDYVRELLAGMQIEDRDGHMIITIPQLDEKKLKELERQTEKMARETERLNSRSTAPKPPKPPSGGIVIDLDGLDDLNVLALSGTTKELEDTLSVTDPKRPIKITNQIGTVRVGGTQSKQIIARLSAGIAADSRTQEKRVLSEIKLNVQSTATGYVIEAATPMTNISGHDARIVSSELEVLVPATNPVTINSSFGDVTVSDLNSGVEITSSYAQIEIENVRGGVDVCNTMGHVELLKCSGPIKVKNAYSSVAIDNCSGTYDIENAYGVISVEGCSGAGEIRNSGTVQVSNHTGNMDIRNSFGPIEVDGLAGNLTAFNQFQPLSVRDIKGTVTVENANSNIEVANVSGLLIATNRFGMIQAEELAGPVRLDNQNGNIYLVLGDAFKGNSWVSTTFGNVDVTIPETANFWVRAKTTFGDIKSELPFKFSDMGTAKSGALKLGRGADSLSIDGENSTIIISGSK